MATCVGAHVHLTTIETAISIALTLRGAKVDLLQCDAATPACLRAKVTQAEPRDLVAGKLVETSCIDCVAKGRKVMDVPGLRRLGLSGLISDGERATARVLAATTSMSDMLSYRWRDVPIGEHALAGALRYFCVGDLSREPEGEAVLRLYFETALLTAYATRRAIERDRYDVVVTNHGIYAQHGVINDAARAMGVRTAAWHTAYRSGCVIFSHGETYHYSLMNEPVSAWENMPWSTGRTEAIKAYLASRRDGGRDWIHFNRNPDENVRAWLAQAGVNLGKPIVGLLTNVIWDARLHYPANAFPDMLDWLRKTIDYFSERPDRQLLIRIHPGELAPANGTTASRQTAEDEIRRWFPTLPSNVFIVSAASKLSTYALMEQCESVLIYGTKTGVELAAAGIPVVVAGEAWIKNKGITFDVHSEQAYFGMIEKLIGAPRITPEVQGRALKYAYHFFLRRMIPLEFFRQVSGEQKFMLEIATLESLAAGHDPGLDTVCRGILEGTPFVYEEGADFR